MSSASTALPPPFVLLRPIPEGSAKTNLHISKKTKVYKQLLIRPRPGALYFEKYVPSVKSGEVQLLIEDLPIFYDLVLGSGPNISDYPTLTTTANIVASEDAEDAPTWFDELTSRILKFALLPNNWDTYNGRRISKDAIQRALQIAILLTDKVSQEELTLSEPPFVAPTSSGGILFEIRNRGRELHIEIDARHPDIYRVAQFSPDPSFEEPADDESVNESQLRGTLSWIVRAGA